MVVGALVMALSISCKDETLTEEVDIGQYAGIYASDTASYGSNTNQYFVLRVNSDSIDYGVSDGLNMSTVAGTFSQFTKTGEGIYASKTGQNFVAAVLNFSGSGLTYIPSSAERLELDDSGNNFIFTVDQIGQQFNMTKIN